MELPPPLPPLPPQESKAWGFWATLGLGLTAMGIMVTIQGLIVGVFAAWNFAQTKVAPGEEPPFEQMMEKLLADPLMLSVSVLLSLPALLAAIWFAIRLRNGRRFGEYLALRQFGWRQFFVWGAALAVALAASDLLLRWMGDVSGEVFTRDLLASGRHLALLMLAISVAAPIGEELLFRGFMFRGIAESRAGLLTAIILPNLLWVSLHFQYAWPTLTALFAMGVVLGCARHFSGSVFLPIVLHFLNNTASTVIAMLTEATPLP